MGEERQRVPSRGYEVKETRIEAESHATGDLGAPEEAQSH
jgi:hypothetical protein